MRIGISMLSHDQSWGGIGVYTREIIRNLLEMDRKNEYVLIYPGFCAERSGFGQYQGVYPNCTEVVTRKSLGWTIFWEQWVLPPFARKLKLDLFFNPFWSVPVFGNYKKVLIVHGVDYHVVPESLNLRNKFEWFLHSYAWVHRADAVISISDMMKRDLIKYDHLAADRIRRIYHGCHPKFRPIADAAVLDAARSRYQLPERFVLFVGMLFPQKNFSNFARAFARIADKVPHKIVVAGRPRWKYSEEIQLIEQLGLKDRVQFLDQVPNDDLPALYNLADCFAFPSFYEAFGLVGVEALASGCPVIAARAGAVPEVLGDAAQYYDPYNVDEMAATMLAMLTDAGLRERSRAAGLERARQFTWKRAAAEVLELFDDVMAGRPAG